MKTFDTPATLDDAFKKACQEALEIFISKNKDYGKGNILEGEELGIAFRVNDKVNRLKNLLTNNLTPQNESIDETWIDIAVYAIIAIMYRRGQFQNLELDTTHHDNTK